MPLSTQVTVVPLPTMGAAGWTACLNLRGVHPAQAQAPASKSTGQAQTAVLPHQPQ